MYFLPINRNLILKYMPNGGKVAEVGVATGEFSKRILDATQPEELHLIDPWQFQDRPDYLADINNVEHQEQEQRFQSVQSTFSMEIMKGTVKIHRQFSEDAAKSFQPGSLDWVYLDAMHTYDAVLADLKLFQSRIKKGGFFLCDDFTNNAVARDMSFGVVEAVRDFTITEDWQLVAMTNDMFPNCLLTREADSESATSLMRKLIYDIPNIVRITDPWNFHHDHVSFAGNRVRLIPTF